MSGKLIYDGTSVSDIEKCCLLCNKYFNAEGQSASADSTENSAISFAYKAFRTFDKHLSAAVKGEIFCLLNKEYYNPTFCKGCIVFAVNLIRIDEEMEEIKKRLKDFVNYLSLEILTAKGLSTFTFQNLITIQPNSNKDSGINKQHDDHLQNGIEIAHSDSVTDINTVKTEPDDTDCQHSSEDDFEGHSFHPTEEDTKNLLSVNNNKRKHKVHRRAIRNKKLVKTIFKVRQLPDLNPFVKLIDINKHPVKKAIGAAVETYRPMKRNSAETARKMLQNRIQKEYSDSEFERSDNHGQTNNEGEMSEEDCEDSNRDEYRPASEQNDGEEAVTADHSNVRKRIAGQSSKLPSKLARKSRTNSNVRNRKIVKQLQCSECEATFSLSKDLDQHNEETGHVNERTFKCRFCDKSYYRHGELRSHAQEHPPANTKTFTCGVCNLKVRTHFLFREHCNSHVGKYFNCNKCVNKFLTEVERKEHEEKYCSFYPCTLCSKYFSGFNGNLRLENHLKRHELISKMKDKKSFVCKVCEEDFALSKELIQHSETTGHINERKFLCSSCPNSYFRKRDLKFHERVHNIKLRDETYRFVCQVCQEEFMLSKDLLEHSEAMGHENEKSFYCSICTNSYFREVDLKFHERLHICKNMSDNKQSFVCQVCEANFTLSKELLEHSESTGHQNERNFLCPICPNSYYREVDLGYHIKLHGNNIDKNSFVCQVCKADFAILKELIEHSEITGHTNAKTFFCSNCPSSYFRRVDLKCHLKTHFPIEAFECEYCNKTFKTALACKNHVARHTGGDAFGGEVLTEEGFYCDDPKCGKWFQYKQSLVRHIKKGHDHLPYMREWPCSECPYISRNKSIFERHFRTHTGEKPFMCEECGFSYATQGGLSIHMRKAHLGIRFSCSICEKTFSTRRSCMDHQSRHLRNEKNFRCGICYLKFPDRKAIRLHQKMHSSQEKHFQCQNCGKGYTKKCRLREHQSKCCAPIYM